MKSNDQFNSARTVVWLANLFVLSIIIFKLIVPGPTASLPITTWSETISNWKLLTGFFAVCFVYMLLGVSVGYRGLPWHFLEAPLGFRIFMVVALTVPIQVVFWMQQRFNFIAGQIHFGIASAFVLSGILVGTALESIRSRERCTEPSRFELLMMNVSIAMLGGTWGLFAASKWKLLEFEVPIRHQTTWSFSVVGVAVGWSISLLLQRWLKCGPTTISFLFCFAAVQVLALPLSSISSVSHEVALSLFGVPTAVTTILAGINAGISMTPSSRK